MMHGTYIEPIACRLVSSPEFGIFWGVEEPNARTLGLRMSKVALDSRMDSGRKMSYDRFHNQNEVQKRPTAVRFVVTLH